MARPSGLVKTRCLNSASATSEYERHQHRGLRHPSRMTAGRRLSVMRGSERMLNGPPVVARELLRRELERDLVELPGEAERDLVVLVVHRCTGVDADVEGLINGHKERN